jgi:hypothetical protein
MKLVSKIKSKIDSLGVEKHYADFSIDSLSTEGFSGWARKCGDISSTSCYVKLYSGDILIAEGKANKYRDDLHDLGYGNGCKGFNLKVNWRALDTGENKLSLLIDDHKVKVIRLPLTIAEFISVAMKEQNRR